MPDDRTYIRVHDGMPDHPKIEPLSDAAFRLLVILWCWCSRHLTDGKINEAVWVKRGTAKARRELIAAGVVERIDEQTVSLHDYLEHQRSAAEVAELKEKRRLAGAKGGQARAQAHAQASAKQVLKQTGSKVQASTETDTEELTTVSSSRPRKRGTRLSADWRPSPELREWTLQRLNQATAALELEKFRNYWTAKSGSGATKLDWEATWRNWVLTVNSQTPTGGRSTTDDRVAQGIALARQLRAQEPKGITDGTETHTG